MPMAFATISFTESVKAAQTRYGSRENNRAFELFDDPRNQLSDRESEFIQSRDSFYMATISENGWPYVQHRGGPKGFLKVLDSRTIGFADLSGNRQYISVGNLNANARISLILMDYPNRRRLKLWGTTRIIHASDEPEMISRLVVSDYQARVERGIVIQVEAIEWNCPQHITPRYSEDEVDLALQPLLDEIKHLREQMQQQGSSGIKMFANEPLGSGSLPLVISGIRQLTPRIRAYELHHPKGDKLPVISAGSHLRVPVLLTNNVPSTRNYSISSNPAQRDSFEIAVLLEAKGTGGSRFVHEHFQLGMHLNCGLPRNDFTLHKDKRSAVLIAGGIGITPIKAMAVALKNEGRTFQFHYIGRSKPDMAYIDSLQTEFGEQLNIHTSSQQGVDLAKLMSNVADDSVFYVCGPQRLIDGVQQTAIKLGISEARIRFERFSSPVIGNTQSIEVELRRSGKTLLVGPDESILNAVEAAGVKTISDCKVGNCGTCAVKVLEGSPLHCDTALTERERTKDKLMCICVSRANSARLVLDL